MSNSDTNYQKGITKEEPIKEVREIKEARLQYEKVYLDLKKKMLGKKKKSINPLIEEHNKKVVEYFEDLLEEQTKAAQKKGGKFTNEDYMRLVKDFWNRMYVFD
ncbi:MAG: hypothetical protein JW891_17125 [Candidatus Lokiarchaeota archaeon]|nr:hypothetical protein [Candidatus Lokiarchaeota archaeon]